jgi:hypothetical protein
MAASTPALLCLKLLPKSFFVSLAFKKCASNVSYASLSPEQSTLVPYSTIS